MIDIFEDIVLISDTSKKISEKEPTSHVVSHSLLSTSEVVQKTEFVTI
jgi:hypothetical protein